MPAGYPVVYRMLQAAFDGGGATDLVGGFVEIIDARGSPTGPMYTTGVSGAPPVSIGGSVYRTAGEDIPAFSVVYDVDGIACALASSDDPGTVERVLGLSVNRATAGHRVQIVHTGVYVGSTGIRSGALFLGLLGTVTTVPATTGVHLQVGAAVSSTVADIDVKTPIYL